MYRLRSTRTIVVALAVMTAVARPVPAQGIDPPPDTSHQLGPLAIAPVFRLADVGRDSNVYNESENPRSDTTATASPSIGVWLRSPALRLAGSGQVAFVYFRRLTELRAVDRAFTARAEIPLRWLMPYFSGTETVTRDGRNFEIDTPVRRVGRSVEAGADVRLTGKVTVGAGARRSRQEYSGDALLNLSESLNRTTEVQTVRFRYAVTPLTSLGVVSERQLDKFTSATGSDPLSYRVMPEVEFQPLALVRGRAQVGFRSRTYADLRTPDYRGLAARVDLQYTLLGSTSFTVGFQRDLEDSYLSQADYVLGGGRVSVRHRLSDPWEVGASVSRYRLNYRSPVGTVDPSSLYPAERVVSVGAEVGYRMGRSGLGFQVDYTKRDVGASILREYERLRLISSVTHDF